MIARRGFSQIELLVAVAILAIGILGVLGSLIYATRAARFGENTTEAVQLARSLIEQIRADNLAYSWDPPEPPATSGLNDNPEERRRLDDPPFEGLFPADSPFRRNIRVVPLTTDDTDYQYGMVRITVLVYWFEQGQEKEIEFQSVHRCP